MVNKEFTALISKEISEGKFERYIGMKKIRELPEYDTLIKVQYSALNYKDALSARGHKGITRKYPHTPGVDAAGFIVETKHPQYQSNQRVLVTGYDLGMNTSGGFGEYIRVPHNWIVPLPEQIDYREAMVYGTAGFTAGIAIYELNNHNVLPHSGPVLVTGATGGVGCLSIALLNKLGYQVVAGTSKKEEIEFLKNCGANEVLGYDEIVDKSGKHLLQSRWAGAIENIGSLALSSIIRSIKPRGAVAVIGNVTGDTFQTSIYPFILRGINLLGIDSAERPMDYRIKIWEKLFNEWRLYNTNHLVKEITLIELNDNIDLMLEGKQIGKIIIKISDN